MLAAGLALLTLAVAGCSGDDAASPETIPTPPVQSTTGPTITVPADLLPPCLAAKDVGELNGRIDDATTAFVQAEQQDGDTEAAWADVIAVVTEVRPLLTEAYAGIAEGFPEFDSDIQVVSLGTDALLQAYLDYDGAFTVDAVTTYLSDQTFTIYAGDVAVAGERIATAVTANCGINLQG